MALYSLYCADVPLRNYSLTHSLTHLFTKVVIGCHLCDETNILTSDHDT